MTAVQIGRSYWLPTIHAGVELKRGNPARALELLRSTSPYELGLNLYPVYVRGQAYLPARNGTAAAAEFQKILDHRGIVVASHHISYFRRKSLSRGGHRLGEGLHSQ